MALTQAVKEFIWLQSLLRDLGALRHLDEMQHINVDIQGAIALAMNAEYHARTKHNLALGLLDHSAFLLQEDANGNTHELDSRDGSTGEGGYCSSLALTLDSSPHRTPTPELRRY